MQGSLASVFLEKTISGGQIGRGKSKKTRVAVFKMELGWLIPQVFPPFTTFFFDLLFIFSLFSHSAVNFALRTLGLASQALFLIFENIF